MCMFLAINTSSVQIIPATAISFLSAAGSTSPTDIVLSSLIATTCSTIVAITAVCVFRRLSRYQVKDNHEYC